MLIPVVLGSADGKVVVGRFVYQGTMIDPLTFVFKKGRLTSMSAASGLDALKAAYESAGVGKEFFSYLDIGLNPEATVLTDTGRIVWMAPGNVAIGIGDNTGWGGSNVSDFGLSGAVAAATLSVDGKVLVEKGALK